MDKLTSQSGFDATFTKAYSIKLGVVLGIISLLVGIAILYITKSLTSFMTLAIVSYGLNTVLYMLIAAAFSFILRKNNGGFWSFSVALKSIFLMLLISTLISTIGTQLYVHFINPNLQHEVLFNTINVTIEYMEQNGAPDDIIDSSVAKLEEQMETVGNITIGQAFNGIIVAVLMQFIFSLVLAAITKREKAFVPNKS